MTAGSKQHGDPQQCRCPRSGVLLVARADTELTRTDVNWRQAGPWFHQNNSLGAPSSAKF